MKLLFTILSITTVLATYSQHTIIVAQKGKAHFRSVQQAINSINNEHKEVVTIRIKNGVYNEKIYLKKSNIRFEGEDKSNTIITQSIARDEWRCTNNNDWGVATVNLDSCSNISFNNLTIRNNYGFENTTVKTIVCSLDSTGTKTVKPSGHQMAFRSFKATKLQFRNCHFIAFGGDTMSPWNTEDGMFYFDNCIMEGGVDFYCPRGWAYATNCTFIAHNGPAAIWHDGSLYQDAKTVLHNCYFKGYDGFKLGRYHRDAQFFLINCRFADNMANEDIYLVPTTNTIQWGRRVYYYNCVKEDGKAYAWHQNNFPENMDVAKINAAWVFNNKWNVY